MTERAGVRMRLIGMKRTLLPLVLLGAVLAGCGDDGDKDSTAEPQDDTVSICSASASTVIKADTDGDGTREPVEFTPGSGDCPAFIRIGDRSTTNLDLSQEITARELSTVRVPGHAGELVLYTFRHPRGGFEARLFAEIDAQVAEVTRRGGPLVPFVATDAATAYTSVACTKSGFAVTSAVAHQPVGVMAAWDVTRTDYGPTLIEGRTAELRDNVTEKILAKDFPELVRNSLFENC